MTIGAVDLNQQVTELCTAFRVIENDRAELITMLRDVSDGLKVAASQMNRDAREIAESIVDDARNLIRRIEGK
jgi:hypothetical protein